ncbi:MAG: hypothetical protein VXA34_07430, partial [Gammaproteobacteria bacterium]
EPNSLGMILKSSRPIIPAWHALSSYSSFHKYRGSAQLSKSALQIRITSLRSVLARESRQFITFLLVAVIDCASHYPFYAGRNP